MSFLLAAGALITTLFLLIGPLPFALAIALQILPDDRKGAVAPSLLISATLWLACQMATATGLAFAGRFALLPMLLCEAGWLGAGYWLFQRTTWPPRPPISQFATRAIVLPLLTWGALALLVLGNLLIQPTTDYDSLYYHLPFAANLYAGGGLLPDHLPAAVAWYPFGWEAFCALFLLPLSTDLLILLPNLLAWGLLGLGLYCVTRALGGAREVALLPSLLLLSQPLLIDQLISLRVDLVLAALFVVGLAFIVAGAIVRPRNQLLLLLLVVMMLAMVKMSGLIYAVLLLVLFALHCCWPRAAGRAAPTRTARAAPFIPALLLLVGLTLVAATLWYGRNWVRYGNPMGEMAIQVGGWLLFPGELTSTMVRGTTLFALFDSSQSEHWHLLLRALWQKSHLPGLLLLLLALVNLSSLLRGDRKISRRLIGLTGGGFLLLWAIYWSSPYSGDDGSFAYQLREQWVAQSLRFALPAFALFAILATLGLSHLYAQYPRRATWVMTVLLASTLLTVAQRSMLYLLGVVGYTTLLLLYLWLPRVQAWLARQWQQGWVRWQQQPWWARAGMGLLVLTVAVPLLLVVQQLHTQQQRRLYGELPTLVAEHSAPGDLIAAVDSHQSYLVQAAALDRRVRHLSTSVTDAEALHAWLAAEQISLIVVGPLQPAWQTDPLVLALTDPAAPYTLLWDGWERHPRLYQLLSP